MIKSIIFDLGNVVIKVDDIMMFKKFAKDSKKPVSEIISIYERSHKRKSFERGEIKPLEFYHSIKKEMGLVMDFNDFKKAYTGIFSHHREMEKRIPELKGKYRLVLLSNTDELHYSYIKKEFPVLNYFDDFVLSHKAGMRKPNPLIFLKAIKKSKTMPWNCIYFDDIPEFVIMARLLGIRAYRYSSSLKLKVALKKAL